MAQLKGHSKIELTDVMTGQKETYENDNMITNAVSRLLSNWYATIGETDANRIFAPIISKAMGGIYIFDTELTESANNIYLPDASVSRLTGYAGNTTSDGNDTMRGDFNASESGEIENGYKLVWDFGTDDANGEIAALAITHSIAGYHGYHFNNFLACTRNTTGTGNKYDNYKGLGYSSNLKTVPNDLKKATDFFKDENGYHIVCAYFSSNTNLRIDKYLIKTDNIALTDENIFKIFKEDTENITVNDTVFTNIPYNYFEFKSGKDGYYYGLGTIYGRLAVCKYNTSTKEYTQATYVGSGYSKTPYYTYKQTDSANAQTIAVRNGYAYLAMKGTRETASVPAFDYYICKLSLNNPSEYTILNEEQITSNTYPEFTLLPNGTIDCQQFLITLEDELIENGAYAETQSTGYTTDITEGVAEMGYFIVKAMSYNSPSYSSYFLPNLQYLATINNLDSPVVKTAAKTMKITYTLTYA